MPNPRRVGRFLVAGVSLNASGPRALVIGRADGDVRVGDALVDESDGRSLGTVETITAYSRALDELSSGMTAELTVLLIEGALPMRVPSTPFVARAG